MAKGIPNNGINIGRFTSERMLGNTINLGRTPWNKGKKTGHAPWRGKKRSEADRAKMSDARLGVEPWNKGKPYPQVTGPNNRNWKGGVTPKHEKARKSLEYVIWRREVFKRDDYTCQACGVRGGKIEADHELPFAHFPGLRYEVLNGRTLCRPCHQKTPTFGANTCVYL